MGRPNVILILADDLGYSDLGCMGSEIRTPNLDALARDGALMSAMYNCARCCPTRAALLTGLYPHRAGIGHMGANLGTPAYQGSLRRDAATIAETLQAGGYRTLMSGKWHVGGDLMAREADRWRPGAPGFPTPRQRGFDRFYGILDGVTHFFSPHFVMEDDTRVTSFGDDFYFTDAITDKAIGMVEDAAAEDAPFFLYLAHAAPHWPLHAPAEDIARYETAYRGGWDSIRTARHEEMNGLGVLPATWDISPRDDQVRPWDSVEDRDWEAAKMAVYAAMVDRMDHSIGRLMAALDRLGLRDDTLVLFLSDNGGCAEFMAEDGWAKFFPDRLADGRQMTMGNVPGLLPGGPLSYQSYDRPWANVSNAPFRLFKHYMHEGGISTPLIAHWPAGITAPVRAHAPAHVVDILPTILEVTGCPALDALGDSAVQTTDGESILPALQGRPWARQAPIFFEHEGNAAVRAGAMKLVRRFGQDWELYDMEIDRTELANLAGRGGATGRRLASEYEAWATSIGVLPWDQALPLLLAAWGMDSAEG
ncbi:MAG: arylsulfatase [Pseudomonadota bacterium]